MLLKKLFPVFIVITILAGCGDKTTQNKNEKTEQSTSKATIQLKIDSLSKAIRQTPKEDTLFYQRAMLYLEQGKVDKAVNNLEIAKKLNSNQPAYYLDLADVELRRGESGIAKDLLESCHEKFPENVEVMTRLANIYMAVQQYKKARTYLIKASRIEPRNPRLYLLSSMIFREIGKTQRAIEELQTAVRYNPDYYDGHVMLGLINARKGNELAIDHYRNAIRIQPENPEAVYNLGMFYQQSGQYDKALETYRNGLADIDSTYQHFLFNAGYVLENYKNMPDSAIRYYQQVIEHYPNDHRAYFRTGQCFEKTGKVNKAMASYEMCLKVNPDFEEAYDALSRLSEKYNKNRGQN